MVSSVPCPLSQLCLCPVPLKQLTEVAVIKQHICVVEEDHYSAQMLSGLCAAWCCFHQSLESSHLHSSAQTKTLTGKLSRCSTHPCFLWSIISHPLHRRQKFNSALAKGFWIFPEPHFTGSINSNNIAKIVSGFPWHKVGCLHHLWWQETRTTILPFEIVISKPFEILFIITETQ